MLRGHSRQIVRYVAFPNAFVFSCRPAGWRLVSSPPIPYQSRILCDSALRIVCIERHQKKHLVKAEKGRVRKGRVFKADICSPNRRILFAAR